MSTESSLEFLKSIRTRSISGVSADNEAINEFMSTRREELGKYIEAASRNSKTYKSPVINTATCEWLISTYKVMACKLIQTSFRTFPKKKSHNRNACDACNSSKGLERCHQRGRNDILRDVIIQENDARQRKDEEGLAEHIMRVTAGKVMTRFLEAHAEEGNELLILCNECHTKFDDKKFIADCHSVSATVSQSKPVPNQEQQDNDTLSGIIGEMSAMRV